MEELKFRAIMKDRNAIKYFTLQDLVNPKTLFSIRELLIPWLLEGNQPDRWIGLRDEDKKEIYEGDVLRWYPNRTKHYSDVVVKYQGNAFYLGGWYENDYPETEKFSRVIGNIHKNPELDIK